jgi:integrase
MVPFAAGELGALAPVMEQTREYLRNSKAESTQRAYRNDWKAWKAWCDTYAFQCLPSTPERVAMYLTNLADTGKKAATITRRLTAISQITGAAGFESPTKNELVRSVLKGIRRKIGTAQEGKSALTAADLKEIVARLPKTLIGVRDKALLCVAWASACRRSETVAFNFEDIEWVNEGVCLIIRRAKNDQEGRGRKLAIPILPHSDCCAVAALREWLAVSGITEGPIFRPVRLGQRIEAKRLSGFAVARIIKKRLPPGRDITRYSGHSTRVGFVTSACAGGASLKAVMNQTGHKSIEMVLRYSREASLFKHHALSACGL